MISLTDVYHVVTATVPLYVAIILAYVSMKWWKLFSPEQCSGINKFVAKFSIPLLSFQVISTNNPYKMNLKLVCADFLQKLLAIFVMTVVVKVRNRGNLSCIITGVSLSTLPNTLILGIPILRAMYGDEAAGLLSQIVVLQSIVWYNLLLFLFELNKMNESSCLIPPPPAIGGLEGPEGAKPEEDECESEQESRIIHSKNKKIMLILLTVGRKLISNPNTHATALGLMWASIHFRWGVKLPQFLDKSISILSDGGLGMALFSLGLFMAMQKSIIACGIRMAVLATTMKFVIGPALMALSSIAIGIRGTLFRVAILQATLPQGIVPFVFAQEYNIHPEILSAGVIFGMLVSLPVALAYYFLLAVEV